MNNPAKRAWNLVFRVFEYTIFVHTTYFVFAYNQPLNRNQVKVGQKKLACFVCEPNRQNEMILYASEMANNQSNFKFMRMKTYTFIFAFAFPKKKKNLWRWNKCTKGRRIDNVDPRCDKCKQNFFLNGQMLHDHEWYYDIQYQMCTSQKFHRLKQIVYSLDGGIVAQPYASHILKQ